MMAHLPPQPIDLRRLVELGLDKITTVVFPDARMAFLDRENTTAAPATPPALPASS